MTFAFPGCQGLKCGLKYQHRSPIAAIQVRLGIGPFSPCPFYGAWFSKPNFGFCGFSGHAAGSPVANNDQPRSPRSHKNTKESAELQGPCGRSSRCSTAQPPPGTPCTWQRRGAAEFCGCNSLETQVAVGQKYVIWNPGKWKLQLQPDVAWWFNVDPHPGGSPLSSRIEDPSLAKPDGGLFVAFCGAPCFFHYL